MKQTFVNRVAALLPRGQARAQRKKIMHEVSTLRGELAQIGDGLAGLHKAFGEITARLDTLYPSAERDRALHAETGTLSADLSAQIRTLNDFICERYNGLSYGLGHVGSITQAFIERADVRSIALEDRSRDIMKMLIHRYAVPPINWRLVTDHPIAEDSPDHLVPRGTRNDNTRHPRFVRRCEELFAGTIRHLDIGCAGGGLVWDFAKRGHLSVGIEGSDYSLREQRAEWTTIPDRLFTADVRHPFHFLDETNELQKFDVISAWEVLEHIPETHVDALLENVRANLAPRGMLAASVATFVDRDEKTGTVWHLTVRPQDWWLERLFTHGLVPVEGRFELLDFARGVGNPRAHDWDVRQNPEMGFHVVAGLAPQ